MTGGHWTEQTFIDHAYGIGPADGHLDVCDRCKSEWDRVRARREAMVREPEIPHEILAEQRRNIYRRLGREPYPSQHWMPAFGAVLLLLIGILFLRPTPEPAVHLPASTSDAQLFSEIYALEQTSEPHVGKPMRSLFEENR